MRWFHAYSVVVFFSTAFLLIAGALVTGKGAGLSVPDWPMSFGQYMPPMVGGVFYEHGHRMVAGTVGVLTLILAVLSQFFERRSSVRWLCRSALLLVIIQAVLGGMTVLFRLPTAVSVAHACTAQLFFCLLGVIVLLTSSVWSQVKPPTGSIQHSLRFFGWAVSGLFFVQILLGAIMRHSGAGLAIPDFPLAFGGLFPPEFSFPIAIHFAHRATAYLILPVTFFYVYLCQKHYSSETHILGFSGLVLASVLIQVFLGALTIWGAKPLAVTTAHLLFGGVCFTSSVITAVVISRTEGTLSAFAAPLQTSTYQSKWVTS